jgi:hypothetical protein
MEQQYIPYLGLALQWARSQPKFAEWYYVGILLLGSAALYVWATPCLSCTPWRQAVSGWFGVMLQTAGATQLTSTGANILSATPLGKAITAKATYAIPKTSA